MSAQLTLISSPRRHTIDPSKPVVIVSNGGGQDSTALIYRLAYDRAFRLRYAGDANILVVFSDTSDEKTETYENIARLEAFCDEHGFAWERLTPDKGFHSPSWQSLESFYRANNTIGSQAFPKSCSPNLKTDVIYRWFAWWLQEHYGGVAARKQSLYSYTERFGKVKVIIGIAFGEEKRMANNDPKPCKPCRATGTIADDRCGKCKGTGIETPRSKWMVDCIERIHPLVHERMDRAACQAYIASVGKPVPPPSNCVMCPFADGRELLWKARYSPERMAAWIALEDAKLAANAHLNAVPNPKTGKLENKNFGVYKTVYLRDALAAAEAEYGWMTRGQLDHHHNSHGHCTATAA